MIRFRRQPDHRHGDRHRGASRSRRRPDQQHRLPGGRHPLVQAKGTGLSEVHGGRTGNGKQPLPLERGRPAGDLHRSRGQRRLAGHCPTTAWISPSAQIRPRGTRVTDPVTFNHGSDRRPGRAGCASSRETSARTGRTASTSATTRAWSTVWTAPTAPSWDTDVLVVEHPGRGGLDHRAALLGAAQQEPGFDALDPGPLRVPLDSVPPPEEAAARRATGRTTRNRGQEPATRRARRPGACSPAPRVPDARLAEPAPEPPGRRRSGHAGCGEDPAAGCRGGSSQRRRTPASTTRGPRPRSWRT